MDFSRGRVDLGGSCTSFDADDPRPLTILETILEAVFAADEFARASVRP